MAKVQTRRTISFNRVLFELMHESAAARGESASQWTTRLVRKELRRLGKELPAQHFAGPPPFGRSNNRGGGQGGAQGCGRETQT